MRKGGENEKVHIFLVLTFLSVNVIAFDSQATEESANWDVTGVYPIDVYDETWADMTFAEQLETVALPDELVDSLSTEEMAEWVLSYPFLGDIFLFDSAEASMDYFSRTSYLFRTFFAREDVIEVLLNKFDELQINYRMLTEDNVDGSDVFIESGYFKELFLQRYFATVIEELSENEKLVLREILEEKYTEKSGICEDFTTATLFYGDVLSEYGEIPAELVFQTDVFSYELVEEQENLDAIAPYSEGFSNSGQIVAYNQGYYYAGSYSKYGVAANCYMFFSGDLSPEEVQNSINYNATHHSSWVRVSDPTRKFNCHSYAWLQQSISNVYWLNTPSAFASSSAFSYIGANGGANNGDHIIITDSYGAPQHSLIATSTGTDCNGINTISKCGSSGIYYAILADIFLVYGNGYEVYR